MTYLAIALAVVALICCAITSNALGKLAKSHGDFATQVAENFQSQGELNKAHSENFDAQITLNGYQARINANLIKATGATQ